MGVCVCVCVGGGGGGNIIIYTLTLCTCTYIKGACMGTVGYTLPRRLILPKYIYEDSLIGKLKMGSFNRNNDKYNCGVMSISSYQWRVQRGRNR